MIHERESASIDLAVSGKYLMKKRCIQLIERTCLQSYRWYNSMNLWVYLGEHKVKERVHQVFAVNGFHA
jgi:hypothetical protein